MFDKPDFMTEPLDRLHIQVTATARKAVEEQCVRIADAARKNAPKNAGSLRNSIVWRVDFSGGEYIGKVAANASHAMFVEFGTGQPGRLGSVSHPYAGRITYTSRKSWRYKKDGRWYTTRGQKPQAFLYKAYKENEPKLADNIKGSHKSRH